MTELEAREQLQTLGIARSMEDDRTCIQIVQEQAARSVEAAPAEAVGQIITTPYELLRSYIAQVPYKERRPYFAR